MTPDYHQNVRLIVLTVLVLEHEQRHQGDSAIGLSQTCLVRMTRLVVERVHSFVKLKLISAISFLSSVKVEVAHVPIPAPLQLENILRLTGADLVVVKHKPIVVVFVRITNLLPFIVSISSSRAGVFRLDPTHVMSLSARGVATR